MKKLFLLFAAAAFALTSCGPEKGGEGSSLTPEQNKEKLEQIALDFANQINADDFTGFVDAVNYLTEEIGMPEIDGTGVEGREIPDPVGRLAGVAEPLLFGQLGMLNKVNGVATRAADYAASGYYGIYTYDDSAAAWSKEASTEELTIKFNFDGEPVTMTARASGAETEVTIEGETISVPTGVTAKMTKGAATLVDITVNIPSINADVTSAEVNTSITVCGYSFATTTTITSSKVAAAVHVKKGGTALLDVVVSGSGSNIVPSEAGNEYEGTVGAFSAAVSILDGEAYVKVGSKNFQNYIDGMNEINADDSEFSGTEKAYAEKYAKIFNDNLSVFMNYDGSGDPIAKLQLKAVEDKEYGEWYAETYVVFTSDKTPILMYDYFNEDDFAEVIDAFEDLANKFDQYLGGEDDEPNPAEYPAR